MTYDIDGAIRRIPHHPKPGILFYDLMPLFEDPAGLDACVTSIADWARPRDIDMLTDPAFNTLRRDILHQIREEAGKSGAAH